jgi:hypothetical protein
VVFITKTSLSITVKAITPSSSFPVGRVVSILIGSLLIMLILGLLISRLVRRTQINSVAKSNPTPTKKKSLSETLQQHLSTTRTNTQAVRISKSYITQSILSSPASICRNLVAIEC